MNIFIKVFLILLIISSCTEEKEKDLKVPKADEIKQMKNINNSSLIHNPVTADEEISPDKAAVITFSEKVFDFGEIEEGDVVEHTFKFTNTGKSPLIISNARASCGCTVPKWPTYPISPGQSGEIDVKFNSKDKAGEIDKSVTVTANTLPNKTSIRIVGLVKK